MSYDFSDGNGALASATGTVPVTAPPLSMSCFFVSDAITTEQQLISINNFSSLGLHNLALDNSSTSQLSAGTFAGGWAVADEGTTLSNGVEYHACGIWTSSTDRVSVLDGDWAGRGSNTTSKVPSGIDKVSIGAQYFNSTGPNFGLNGRIAEVGIWNAALVQAEVEALAAGVSPLLIRPGNLVFYVPLVGDQKDDLTGTAPVTADGTTPTVVEQHPAIYKPHNQVIRFPSVAAPVSGRIMSSLTNHGGLAGMGGLAGKGGGLAG